MAYDTNVRLTNSADGYICGIDDVEGLRAALPGHKYKHTVNVGNPATSTTKFRFYSKNQSQITSVSDILTVDFICFNYLSVGIGAGSIKGQVLAVYMDSSNICIKYIDSTGTLTQVTTEFTYLVDTVTTVI